MVFGLIFLMCEPGERVSTQFQLFDDELVRCNWYKLSIKLRQMYLIFLSDTEQPMNIVSYGGIQCTRETSKNVNISMSKR